MIGEFVAVWCLTGPDSTDQIEVFPTAADKICRMAYAEHSLLLFYTLLREALRSYPQPHLEFAAYVNARITTGQYDVLCRVLEDEERRRAS